MKNLVYFGSPEFSANILESIINSQKVNVVGIVTTEDKPQGRKQILTPTPLSLLGGKYDLPVYKPAKLDDSNLAHLKLLKPDIFLVVSYGKFIPASWIEAPSIGTFNIHFSLLPKYRGALCISEAIKNGDTETGVTFMKMDNLLDHGPVIAVEKVSISIDDNVSTLTTKLSEKAQALLSSTLDTITDNSYISTPQDESQVIITPSHRIQTRANSFIPFTTIQNALSGIESYKVHNQIRSNNPEPGSWTTIGTQDLKILSTTLANNKLSIETIQLSGKNPISWKQFLSSHPELK